MNVLVISHTYISAINRDKWKVLAQQHKDIFVTVLFPTQWPSCLFTHEAQIDESEHLPNCRFVAIEAYNVGNELLYYYNNTKLLALIRSLKPDLIHVEQGAGAVSHLQATWYSKFVSRSTKNIFFTWLNWQQKLSLKHTLFLSPIEKINLFQAHGAIAGNADAAVILKNNGFEKPILVLPQIGVNMNIFKPIPSVKSKKYVGYIGRFALEKGIFDLLAAFSVLSKQYPEWDLIFIGKGPAHNELKSLIKQHNLEDRIHLMQTVPHEMIAQALNTLDILVLPSHDTPTWREQFGHVLIEAMACKVPIIGSDGGEIPHVIDSAGLIFPQKNKDRLLAQLEILMQDEFLRTELGERGYKRAQEHYSHESIANKTHAFWHEIIDQT